MTTNNPPFAKNDTAVAEVDNVTVVADYSHIAALEEEPLLVTNKTGVPIEKARPDTHYEWVSNGTLGTKDRVGLKKMQGLVVVTDPDIVAPAQGEEQRKKDGCVRVQELTLMQCPTQLWQMRKDFMTKRIDERERVLKQQTAASAQNQLPDGINIVKAEVKMTRGG